MKKILSALFSSVLWCFITLFLLNYLGYFDDGGDTFFSTISDVEGKSDTDEIKASGELITDNEKDDLESSSTTGEDYTFLENFNPYYELLDEVEKLIYKQVYANALERTAVFKPRAELHIDVISKVIESVYYDHPELFWLDTAFEYRYTDDNICVQVKLMFNDTVVNFEDNKYRFDLVVNDIVSSARNMGSAYEKEVFVHNKLIEILDYNENSRFNQSAFGALVNRSTVCAGYARAFQHIMNSLGVPTYYVVGDANGNHAWNIVKLEDGYYNVDLTWDDNDVDIYAFFNKSDVDFAETHTRTGLSQKLPVCDNVTGYLEKSNDDSSFMKNRYAFS